MQLLDPGSCSAMKPVIVMGYRYGLNELKIISSIDTSIHRIINCNATRTVHIANSNPVVSMAKDYLYAISNFALITLGLCVSVDLQCWEIDFLS